MPADDFCKIIVPCAIRPLSRSRGAARRGGVGVAFSTVRFPGVKERFSAGRGFILQQLPLHPSSRLGRGASSSASRIGRLRFYRSRHSILQICYYCRLVQTFTPANAQIAQQSRANYRISHARISRTYDILIDARCANLTPTDSRPSEESLLADSRLLLIIKSANALYETFIDQSD